MVLRIKLRAFNTCFLEKKSKLHVTLNLGWLLVSNTLFHNDIAYKSNNQTFLGSILRYQVQLETKRIGNFQKAEPKKWHQHIKDVTNFSQTKLSLDIPGIENSDIKGKANVIDTKFAHVPEGLDPLD